MKKILSIMSMTLLTLILVACGGTQTTNKSVRVSVPMSDIKSVSMELRLTVTDPEELLTADSIVLTLTGPEDFEQIFDGENTMSNEKFLFENLTASTKYEFRVHGEVDGKNQLLFSNSYSTAKIGEFEENPILIESVEDFKNMRGTNQDGKHRLYYKQTKDLDFEGESLQAIFSSGRSFSGGYDGNGFAIKNLSISERADVNRAYPSIFGYVSSAKIENMVLDNVSFDNTIADNAVYSGSLYVSLLVSKISTNNAIINNITVKNSSINVEHNTGGSSTNRNTYVGLILGSGQGTITNINIENSTVNANIAGINTTTTATEGTFIGGAIGLVELERAKKIENLFVDVELSVNLTQHRSNSSKGNLYLGGVIGSHRGYVDVNGIVFSGSLLFEYTAHEDSEFLDTFMIGGLIGQVKKGSLYNAYVTGAVTTNFASTVGEAFIATTIGLSDFSGNMIVAASTLTVTGLEVEGEALGFVYSLYNFSRPQHWSPNEFLRTNDAKVIFNTVDEDLTVIETITTAELINYFDNEALISYLS